MVSQSVGCTQGLSGLTLIRDTSSEFDRIDPQGGIRDWIRCDCLDVCFEYRACDAMTNYLLS